MYNEFGVPHEVFENPKFLDLSANAIRLYVFLCKLKNRLGNKDGLFWRSMSMLQNDTKMSIRTLKRAKKELLDAGFIEKSRGYYTKGHRHADWFHVNGYNQEGKFGTR